MDIVRSFSQNTLLILLFSKIAIHARTKNFNLSFIDGSGELVNLRLSGKKTEIPSHNLDFLLFEFACLDVKIVTIQTPQYFVGINILQNDRNQLEVVNFSILKRSKLSPAA